jgi:hypothetical protein
MTLCPDDSTVLQERDRLLLLADEAGDIKLLGAPVEVTAPVVEGLMAPTSVRRR